MKIEWLAVKKAIISACARLAQRTGVSAGAEGALQSGVLMAEMTVEQIGSWSVEQMASLSGAHYAAMSMEQLQALDQRIVEQVDNMAQKTLNMIEERIKTLPTVRAVGAGI